MHRRHARILGGIWLGLLLACEPPLEEAPEDINGIAHWLWAHYDDADDAALADAVHKAHLAAGFDRYTEEDRGLLRDLTKDELVVVGMQARDPKPAQGMYLIHMFDCTLPALDAILSAVDQGSMYPEVYDTYERTYTTSLDDYRARAERFLRWDMTYEATPMPSARYSASSKGSLRYLGASDGVELAHGPAILQRIYMPEPAHYFDTDANEFLFDFQLELYYEPAPGRIAHFYPVWRHMAFNGVGQSTDDNWIIDTILDGLRDWDLRTQELCADDG